LFIQNREIDGKENDGAGDNSPELEQRGKHAAAAAGKRKSGQPAASKKPRVSTAHPAAAAAPPDTEAKPLSERLAANRKRSLAQPQQAEFGQEEGSPLKKPKAHKAKSAPGTGALSMQDSQKCKHDL
jgi:hypothetical protein